MNDALEKILHSKKIRYDVLNEVTKTKIPEGYDTVNIFLDVGSILNSLYKPEMLQMFGKLKREQRLAISSEGILNAAAHYRHYFWSRLEMYTNVYFYYSGKPAKRMLQINDKYRSDYYRKRGPASPEFAGLNEVMDINIKLARGVCEYIPYVYFLDTGETDHRVVPYLFHVPGQLTCVISNDPLAVQYTEIDEYAIVMTAKGEKSDVVDRESAIASVAGSDDKVPGFISPELLPYVFALSGSKRYDIDAVRRGIGPLKALGRIRGWLEDGLISQTAYDDPDDLIARVSKDERKGALTDEELKVLEQNFRVLSIKDSFACITDAEVAMLRSQITDLYDPESLKRVNERYYGANYIKLDYLFEGFSGVVGT
jgi:hypothetical protein